MKLRLAVALGAAVALAAPSVASAETYLSKTQAESNARDYASDNYQSQYPGAFCRPQGLSAPARGYVYHRWVCTWVDEADCEGRLLIIGSHRGRGWYQAQVLRGQRCPA